MVELPSLADVRIGVIGLGYVGLPVAAFMGLHFPSPAGILRPDV